MVLVWYATEQSSSTRSQLDTRAIEEKLEQVEQFLDKMKQP
jgi:hypothetical protein